MLFLDPADVSPEAEISLFANPFFEDSAFGFHVTSHLLQAIVLNGLLSALTTMDSHYS